MRQPVGLSLGIAALIACSGLVRAEETPKFHQVAKIEIGGEGGWDYLTMDSTAHRLYVTRGTHVMVIDTEKNAVCGDIPDTQGVHGVALAPKLNKGFTSNGRANTVTEFDLKTLKPIKTIEVGQNPDAILYDAATNRLFTFNGRSNDITAVDAVTDKILATIPAGGKPEFCATNGKGMVFCNVEDKSEILAIDAKTLHRKGALAHLPRRRGLRARHRQQTPSALRGLQQREDGNRRCRKRQGARHPDHRKRAGRRGV